MASNDFIIRAPSSAEDMEAVIDLASRVFPYPYFIFRDYSRNEYFDPHDYDAAASRIGVMDGRVVSHWGIWGHTVRVGRARWRMAGVGAVATHADFRNRGFLAQTARVALDDLVADGRYDATMLSGIPGFYHRFGYVQALTPTVYTLSVANLPPAPPTPVEPERVGLEGRAALDRLHNRQYAEATGTIERPFLAKRPPGSHDAKARAKTPDGWYAWRAPGDDPSGKGSGYVTAVFEAGRLVISESVGEPGAVLAAAGVLARRYQALEIRFDSLSPTWPLARKLRRLNALEIRTHLENRGPMGRTLRLSEMLRKMATELTDRLRDTAPDHPEGPLVTLSDPRERVTLSWREGRVRITDAQPVTGAKAGRKSRGMAPMEEVFQLLFGTYPAAEVLERAGVAVDRSTMRILNSLFPERHPQWPGMDRY